MILSGSLIGPYDIIIVQKLSVFNNIRFINNCDNKIR